MYKKVHSDGQINFLDFNQTCGMQLDPNNEYIRLADKLDWEHLEEGYANLFPSEKGNPAKPLRMVLGALLVKKKKKLS